jgi:hypothetical protein
MALPDPDGSVGHSFGLELDGVQIRQINEVSGLTIEQDVIELKEDITSTSVAPSARAASTSPAVTARPSR